MICSSCYKFKKLYDLAVNVLEVFTAQVDSFMREDQKNPRIIFWRADPLVQSSPAR